MSLSQVRNYLKAKIEAYDTDFEEWMDGFAVDNIPSNLIDKTYHIQIGPVVTAPLNDVSFEDNITAVVRFWRRGRRNVVETREEALDDANCIRLAIVDHVGIKATENIRAIYPASIETVAIDDTNDNTIQVNLTLTLKLFYKTT